MVAIDTPTAARSASASSTSSAVSPSPTIRPDFVVQPGRGAAGEHRQRPQVAGARSHGTLESRDGLHIVVEDVGSRLEEDRQRIGVALQVTREHFDAVSGERSRMARTVAAIAPAPPSGDRRARRR